MNGLRRFIRKLAILFLALISFCGCTTDNSTEAILQLHTRYRIQNHDTKAWVVIEKSQSWRASETAVIVCDMWDQHWCKGATESTAIIAREMNPVLKAARANGVCIVHAPSGEIEFYKDHPARKRILDAPYAKPPAPIAEWYDLDTTLEAELPIDDSDEGCDCSPRCKPRSIKTRQTPLIEIMDEDVISDSGQEIYNYLKFKGIKNVVMTGVHTNMCILGRPFGIRSLKKLGINVVLARDLTDALYNHEMPPYVSHERGTELVIEHIEKYWVPTILSEDLIKTFPGGKKADNLQKHDRAIKGPKSSDHYQDYATDVDSDYNHASPAAYETFKDFKYGLRIHWGPYAMYDDNASWIISEKPFWFQGMYHDLGNNWYPSGFNASEWVDLMIRTGFKFFVFTTKHHDGFSMYDTRTRIKKRPVFFDSDSGKIEDCDLHYSIMETPFKRDITGELVKEAREAGLGIGLYFSHIDWYDADFRLGQWHPLYDTSYTRQTDPVAWDRFVTRHRNQLKELLTNYGKVDMVSLDMYFDERSWPDMKQTMKEIRKIQPDVMFRWRGIGNYGDYYTPENYIPDDPNNESVTMPWQVIHTLSERPTFSYEPDPALLRGADWIVEKLCDVVAKGGNLMVGVGPDMNGVYHPKVVDILEEAGDWLKVNGEAIFNTNPWDKNKEGENIRFTSSKDGKFVYLIHLGWPGKSIKTRYLRAENASDISLLGLEKPLVWEQDEDFLLVNLPDNLQNEKERPCRFAYVLKVKVQPVEFIRNPEIYPVQKRWENQNVKVSLFSGTCNSSIYYTLDGTEPTTESLLFTKPFPIKESLVVRARAYFPGKIKSDIVSAHYSLVDSTVNGLKYNYYEGNWTKIPDLERMVPLKSGQVFEFGLNDIETREDHYAISFTGYIKIPKEGEYTFYTKSDDGSMLYIGGELVVDNDGSHAVKEEYGTINLKAAKYPVKLEYLEDWSGQSLEVSFNGPGIEKQLVPASLLFMEPGKRGF